MMYRREIDGLRALAVLPVILFHAGFEVFSGGFVGVDVFFVISGYLITTILINDLEQDRFSILRFYERRARRILPALFFVMLCCLPFAWVWMTPAQFKDFGQSLVAVGLFASNILFWIESGYFEAAAEEKPLLHTWSLAVEEQYYVLFPIFLLLLWRFGRMPVFYCICALSLFSLALSEWGARAFPSANFYFLPTRAWELFAGSLAAFWQVGRMAWAHNGLAALGLGLIVFAIFYYDHSTPFPSLYALAPVCGSVLVILYAQEKTWAGRLLASRILVAIGLISYSAYLWHQPLFAFARIHSVFTPDPLLMLALVVVSLGLAAFSWRFVERPFRNPKTGFLRGQRPVFTASLVGILACLSIGLWAHLSDGRAQYWLKNMPEEKKQLVAQFERLTREHKRPPHGDGACIFATDQITEQYKRKASDCFDQYGSGVAVLGDSHAVDLFGALRAHSEGEMFIAGFVSGGCRPHTQAGHCEYDDFLALVAERPELFDLVIYEQAGFYLLYGPDGRVGNREMFTVSIEQAIPAFKPNMQFVNRVRSYLAQLAQYTRVVWLSPRIEPHFPQELVIELGCEYPFALRSGQREVFEMLDRSLAQLVAPTEVEFVSQNDLIQFDFATDYMSCDEAYWSDGDHYSAAGEARFGGRMDLLRLLKSSE